MNRKSNKISIIISIIMIFAMIGAISFAAYWLPVVVDAALSVPDNLGNRGEVTESGRVFILVDAYVIVAIIYAALVAMFFLLREVLRERVFGKRALLFLSLVYWCCFVEGALFALLFSYFQLSLCVTVAFCLLGVCLRVVKNVLEEGARIKSENDYTI